MKTSNRFIFSVFVLLAHPAVLNAKGITQGLPASPAAIAAAEQGGTVYLVDASYKRIGKFISQDANGAAGYTDAAGNVQSIGKGGWDLVEPTGNCKDNFCRGQKVVDTVNRKTGVIIGFLQNGVAAYLMDSRDVGAQSLLRLGKINEIVDPVRAVDTAFNAESTQVAQQNAARAQEKAIKEANETATGRSYTAQSSRESSTCFDSNSTNAVLDQIKNNAAEHACSLAVKKCRAAELAKNPNAIFYCTSSLYPTSSDAEITKADLNSSGCERPRYFSFAEATASCTVRSYPGSSMSGLRENSTYNDD